jgi:hypothetical protein
MDLNVLSNIRSLDDLVHRGLEVQTEISAHRRYRQKKMVRANMRSVQGDSYSRSLTMSGWRGTGLGQKKSAKPCQAHYGSYRYFYLVIRHSEETQEDMRAGKDL